MRVGQMRQRECGHLKRSARLPVIWSRRTTILRSSKKSAESPVMYWQAGRVSARIKDNTVHPRST
jgi:hypothetical protein